MPGLIIFNRRWMIGSDDLVIPNSIAVVIRTAWLLLVVIVFGIHVGTLEKETCNNHHSDIYFIVYLVVLVVSCITDAIIAWLSSRGTIFDDTRRANIVHFLYLRALTLFFEFACACVGVYYVIYGDEECVHDYDKWLSRGVVIFNFVWVFVYLVVIFLAYDSAGSLWYQLTRRDSHRYETCDTVQMRKEITERYTKDWMGSCRMLFCCTKTEISKDNVLLFASKLFAEYFQSYTDLVPSDILAGLILLRQKQKYEENMRISKELKDTNASYQQVTKHKSHKSVRRHQKTPNSIPFKINDKDEMALLNEVTYYSKYALACYGWPMYCLLHKLPVCRRAGFRLMSHVRCCGGCRKKPEHYPVVTGDNCCLCNYATQKVVLDVNNDNFIYVSYSSEIFQTPFNIIVDNSKESIIVSVRGTLSLKDVLTDLAIDEERIPGGDPEWTAHKGFLNAAIKIKNIIEEKELIEAARNFDTEKGSQNYKIVLVGHSLGAGTATLLAFLLKEKYPSLVCYAYGPSGSAVSYEAASYARDFIYSVVLGKDMICRLNYFTMHEMQHNILQLLKNTHLPKWKILRGCMCQCVLCCTNSSTHSYHEYFVDEENINNIEPYHAPDVRKLYMAGKIVHVCKTKSIYPRFGSKKATYQAYWSTPEDFQHLLISNLMLQDHFPDALMNAMHSILPGDADDIITVLNEDDNGSRSIVNILSPTSLNSSLPLDSETGTVSATNASHLGSDPDFDETSNLIRDTGAQNV